MSVDDGVDAIPGIVRSEEHVATIKTQVADALERYKTAWLRYWSHEFRVFELPAELQNQIYERYDTVMSQDLLDATVMREIALSRCRDNRFYKRKIILPALQRCHGLRPNNGLSSRTFFPLAQVSKYVRSQYFPGNRFGDFTHRILLPDLPKYTRTFIKTPINFRIIIDIDINMVAPSEHI